MVYKRFSDIGERYTQLLSAPAEIVLVNEIVGGAETAGYLLKYDSIHGTW